MFDVEIDYLRSRFAEPGNRISVTVRNCTQIMFLPWDSGADPLTGFEAVRDLNLDILSAEQSDSICRVHCDGGHLDLAADDARLALDSGRELPLEELLSVAEGYWDDWEKGSD